MTTDQTAGGRIIDLQTTPDAQPLNGRYRRNGKLQSCEPCRRSKQRCDHVVPVCRRCIKRRCADRCVYHPSPLTKARKDAPITPASSTRESGTPRVLSSIESPPPASSSAVTDEEASLAAPEASRSAGHGLPLPPPHRDRAASAPPLHTHDAHESPRAETRFLGATNYASTLAEDLGAFGVAPPDALEPARVPVSNDKILRGCQVLAFFVRHRALVNRFVGRFYEIAEGSASVVPEFFAKQWLKLFWAHFQEPLKKGGPDYPDHPGQLRALCELLWRNTQAGGLAFGPATTPLQWAHLATAHNIRWEVIGILVAIVGQCMGTLPPSDHLLREFNVVRPAFPRQLSEIVATCATFARDCEALDDLFLWLLVESQILTDSLWGDGSYAAYRESAETISAVVAMGLHQDIRAGKKALPFFLEELRRRLMAVVYILEIAMSSFLGRPPRLSHRYCNLVAPLDLPDSDAFEGDERLARARARLDENGFNTSGRLSRTTYLKVWLCFCPIREDVLDLALGRYTRDEILLRAEQIRARSDPARHDLPPFIREIWRSAAGDGDAGDSSSGYLGSAARTGTKTTTPFQMVYRLIILNGWRATELLLQRVLIRKTGASADRLVRTARDIFGDVLAVTRRHDVASVLQNDMALLLAIQGMRSAAVIAVELLKQEQQQQQHHQQQHGSSANDKSPPPLLLPRSRTIQDLSVFAARLGDVDPSDGAFGMCDQGRKVITRILDRILSPPSSTLVPAPPPPPPPPPPPSTLPPADRRPPQPGGDGHGHPAEAATTTNEFGGGGGDAWLVPDAVDFSAAAGGMDFNLQDMDMDMPFLGHDSDFMQWLESADWGG
ncbi:hypothetical protein GGR56DRAFT_667875 [Xylariaceae sp. FL0804]|nr:hypothetical protein GGR56DRAFT_667875 [Xylariaceae sp. FL0804]